MKPLKVKLLFKRSRNTITPTEEYLLVKLVGDVAVRLTLPGQNKVTVLRCGDTTSEEGVADLACRSNVEVTVI